ncbi:phage P4 alpha zinc-binding domain-containing protein [Acidithiobacillus caldus SM-1]|uniref:Phage P4 alpha zinc-binding domain-containing protein n=1 Tax=Acidithiobacillus caldus (strain SM-1) TaxID=990288 RepID=F9ZR51_ACICS|nr:primase-helicase zinc-binding domain-containing protein [Acidithiobacillus caldus]AEK58787.1 phage P4 alpha zinc-binding domain-containing protein [Acidithiobacillus caldus SM-1]
MENKRYDAAAVRQAARDNWDVVLAHLAPEIQPALDRPGRHMPCPVHGGKDGFRVFKNVRETGGGICNTCGPYSDGFALLMWLRNWDFVTTLGAVAELLGTGATAEFSHRRAPAPAKAKERMDNQKRLSETWAGGFPITAPEAQAARTYFAARGVPIDGWLSLVPDHEQVLRMHPGLTYYREGELEGRFPAILCLVVDKAGKAVNIHRTYLAEDGRSKAPVQAPKKLMSPFPGRTTAGAAIRLGPIQNGLVQCAEGLETAVAIMTARGKPVWPVVSDTLMGAFEPPDDAHTVIIWADHDRPQLVHDRSIRPGEFYAHKLATRLHEQGRRTRILIPHYPIPDGSKSVDWLDVLTEHGPECVGPSRAVVQLPSAKKSEGGILAKIASLCRVS